MKRFMIICFSIIIATNLNAQVQKGAILTGGSISYNVQDNSDEFSANSGAVIHEFKSEFIALRPKIGFFTSESVLLGIGLTYEYNSLEQENSVNGNIGTFNEKHNTFLINPYLTKFSELTDKLYFTSTISLLAGIGTRELGENNPVETNTLEFRLNVVPSLTYFISNKWALWAGIGRLYFSHKQEKLATVNGSSDDRKNTETNYGLNISFNTFTIGFQYYLNNPEKE